MPAGALTGYMDVAQMTLYAFWIFFAGLIIYLRREDKREGYPLVAERGETNDRIVGFPDAPAPKYFKLHGGGTAQSGRSDDRDVRLTPAGPSNGAPFRPVGNPLVDGVGPAAYADRAHEPELTLDGDPKIVPLSSDESFYLDPQDPDPRGMLVIAADGEVVGSVEDVWVDRSDVMIRYLEVALDGAGTILVPFVMSTLNARQRQIRVNALVAKQFADAPRTASPNSITMVEEDRIQGYFAGGTLYATPARQEPLL
ncbi:photosynthetic reaction center subunit H [Afifella marina]|uniref:Photosynthetic reaction center H subunit n=1 Tax=Afifella marina DSM 2698 TaxID=1120955 RepID=A0A1G5P258_AFIMA|nr:photosynthetic reaction center subunit H [Afifella marina]MBK1624335.1 photosynthetic reaction center subunit H [Afifella marina DSM 2698]MBK1628067.1 photosynthetic reaction center subunit H [Afifella marina]MBK5918262.1 photosynthetic reaction center subunit H [Afifella marina]RAI19296.1 photosynthetic reaction center subunit H [Afifella marina DSM 2698]SCZ43050.1 photosynthetic reaction center H subunit [Afifella marina DSM 2698]